MIPAIAVRGQPPEWQRELAGAVRDPAELLALLQLDPALLPGARAAAEQFPLRVPRGFVARMRPGDPDDPLLRQVLPLASELETVPGFVADPVGDLEVSLTPGLLQKYAGRVLLVTTGACGVHCRYCFRRHFPYGQESPRGKGLDLALERIAGDPEISEVILSGGDPLSLSDERLVGLIERIEAIPHVRRLRLHSRQPVVLPSRVTEALARSLAASRLQSVMVIHANHANELDNAVLGALDRLRVAGVTLLNQAVLLKGVNDSVAALADLSETLFAGAVLPYYLHLLDPVQGAAHFEVAEDRALGLIEALRARLPGYLVPRLVREEAGAPSKTVRA